MIKEEYNKNMIPLLTDKKKKDLVNECSNENCCKNKKENLFKHCQPLQRVSNVLKLYHKLLHENKLWKKVSVGRMIIISDKYGHRQLQNDFLHVKLVHIDTDNKKYFQKRNAKINNNDEPEGLAQYICETFLQLYKCKNIENCGAFKRHYRDRSDRNKEKTLYHRIEDTSSKKAHEIRNDKEQIITEECDKIHSYFLQFSYYFTTYIFN